MSLLGKATSGVDPQTGSYLSSEQRIAMFKGATGRSGYAGRSSGGTNARVAPQNSIVVVNKLSAISTDLQSNFKTANETIAAQVAQNKKDIENLYSFINNRQQQQLLAEKKETKEDRLEAQRTRFRMREKFIEGLSSVAAGAATAAKGVAEAAAKPMMSFLDKLKNALLLLAGAWLIKNLPSIINDLQYAFDNLDETRRELTKQTLNQRGWASGVEEFIRSLLRRARQITRTVYKFANWAGNKAINITSKIFTKVRDFSTKLFRGVARKISGIWSGLIRKFKDLLPTNIKDGIKAVAESKPVKVVTEAAKGTFNYFKNVGSDLMKGNFRAAGQKALKPFGDAATGFKNFVTSGANKTVTDFNASQGVKEATPQARQKGLKKMFDPIFKAMGKLGVPASFFSKILKTASKMPVFGSIVDIVLNKASGLSWMDSIINGIASSIGGVIGWKAGAAMGSTVGTIGGPPGMAIGAIIGGLIGSIAGGAIGDSVAQATFGTEGAGDINPGVVDATSDLIGGKGSVSEVTAALGNAMGLTADQEMRTPKIKANLSGAFEGTASTPDGFTLSGNNGSDISYDFVELPPTTTKISPENSDSPQEQRASGPPPLSATDPLMDAYRNFALLEYQLN